MSVITVKIQPIGRPHISSRIYGEELLQNICDKNNIVFGQIGMIKWNFNKKSFQSMPMETVSHSIRNLRLEDGWMVGDVYPTDNVSGIILINKIKHNEVGFRMAGIGSLGIGNIVTSYDLHSIHACDLKEEQTCQEKGIEL